MVNEKKIFPVSGVREKDVEPSGLSNKEYVNSASVEKVSVGRLSFHDLNLHNASKILRDWGNEKNRVLDGVDEINNCKQLDKEQRVEANKSSLHYVVTPNMDHIARLVNRSYESILPIYQKADLLLCDSRILQKLIQMLHGKKLPVVAGSDLTEYLFASVLQSNDHVAILGGDDGVISRVREKYSHLNISHVNPSMGFINKPEEIDSLSAWVKETQPNFIFLALGSPQQEKLAEALKKSGCRGVVLCIGASIRFLVGDEVRAPILLQHLHLEWLFRMLQSPRRLVPRYLGNFLAIPKVWRFMRQSSTPT